VVVFGWQRYGKKLYRKLALLTNTPPVQPVKLLAKAIQLKYG